jgi:hypothetical protein
MGTKYINLGVQYRKAIMSVIYEVLKNILCKYIYHNVVY